MAEVVGRTVINVKGLENMSREVRKGLMSTGPGPMTEARKQWAVRYRGEMRDRFDRFSKGGGDWPDLKPATIARRRHGRGGKFKRGHRAHAKAKATSGGQISILRDTGQLFAVLSPVFRRLPGQLEKLVPFGIVVGFGGPGRKTTRRGKRTAATVADVATYHHAGMKPNPERKLLVDPSPRVARLMAGDMERAIQKVVKASQVRPV